MSHRVYSQSEVEHGNTLRSAFAVSSMVVVVGVVVVNVLGSVFVVRGGVVVVDVDVGLLVNVIGGANVVCSVGVGDEDSVVVTPVDVPAVENV